MDTTAGCVSFESVNTRNLSRTDLSQMNEVMQEIWASESGLWELAQCNECGVMISKEDAFGHLPEVVNHTVAHIMRTLEIDAIPCVKCCGTTRLIYWPGNVDKIHDRLTNSADSFLVFCRDAVGNIVGFNEGYVSSLERIFELDLYDHYGEVGLPEIRRRINSILGFSPKEMLHMSAMGLLKPYRSFRNLFQLIHYYALRLPEIPGGMPWIVEYERGGPTHRMNSDVRRGISLQIEDDPELRAKMRRLWKSYEPDLIVYPDAIGMHKDFFAHDMRHYLRASKSKSAENRSPILVME